MTTKTTIRETDIASVVVAYLKGCGMQVRQDVPVTHPTEGLVSVDILAVNGDSLTAIECKRRLNGELKAQCLRWVGMANSIIAAHESHKRVTDRYREIADELHTAGVSRLVIQNGRIYGNQPSGVDHGADTRLLMEAFRSHDGSHDAQAGSAAAKRMTPERCQWEPLRKYLDPFTPQAFRWSTIRQHVPEMRRYTSARAVKAIDSGECVGVNYTAHAPRQFYATEEKQ